MSKSIYDQHAQAFRLVSSYIIFNSKMERVATVAFKYPRDGAGILWCYLHVIGLPMVRANAGGYGYDKASHAFDKACLLQAKVELEDWQTKDAYQDRFDIANDFVNAMEGRDGYDWDHNLQEAGYKVFRAI